MTQNHLLNTDLDGVDEILSGETSRNGLLLPLFESLSGAADDRELGCLMTFMCLSPERLNANESSCGSL